MIRKIIAGVQAAYIAIISATAEVLSGTSLHPIRIENRRSWRGATFIEYALLAAVAVGIIAFFQSQLRDIAGTLIDRIRGGVQGG